MAVKPFKPLTIGGQFRPISNLDGTNDGRSATERARKRRKLFKSDDEDEDEAADENVHSESTVVLAPKPKSTFVAPRVALKPVANESRPAASPTASVESYYMVLWRKPTNKKHKGWDGDGVLSVRNGWASLQDIDGRELGRTACDRPLISGAALKVGGKDVEVDQLISKADFMAGKPFMGGKLPEKPPPQASFNKPKHKVKVNGPAKSSEGDDVVLASQPSFKSQFKTPMVKRPGVMTPAMQKTTDKPKPWFDPHAPDALVMKQPKHVPQGKQLVDVVIDPLLNRHLREHQREGVRFLYECVMGLRTDAGVGAILADEMGLGKTLQTIALLWTLMKQNPIWKEPPVVRKALIVCPVTLVNNWRKEIRKWLGPDRLGVFVVDDKNSRISDFTKGKSYNIMIVGYEKLRLIQEDLQKCKMIDIVIADEGHRLKSAQNKAAAAIKAMDTDRRIILTGTPIQNDLSEFHAMVDLVNPGLLSNYATFKRTFEGPIIASRQPNATSKVVETGEARSEELAQETSKFILRRTSDIIAKYLPPKTESVLLCKPTAAQARLYQAVIESPLFGATLGSPECALQLITILKKLCNSPALLRNALKDEKDGSATKQTSALLSDIDPKLIKVGQNASAKLQVLDALLHTLRQDTEEKIVIASHSTAVLDILTGFLNSLSYPHVRIDGQTPANKRQGIVDAFNKAPADKTFACLLSTKAGGMGINLIGASRLVLFDSDWNPAHDLQAMARIHRDGQKRPCYIYRLLVQGTLDEKIYQRQLTKSGLADAIVDSKKTAQGFTGEELRDLFRLDLSETCGSHELLGCDCGGNGNAQALEAAKETKPKFGTTMDDAAADYDSEEDDEPLIGKLITADRFGELEEQEEKRRKKDSQDKMLALMQYLHIDTRKVRDDDANVISLIEDQILLNVLKEQGNLVSFVFARTTG